MRRSEGEMMLQYNPYPYTSIFTPAAETKSKSHVPKTQLHLIKLKISPHLQPIAKCAHPTSYYPTTFTAPTAPMARTTPDTCSRVPICSIVSPLDTWCELMSALKSIKETRISRPTLRVASYLVCAHVNNS